MLGLDSNVVIRYIMRDDPVQTNQATEIIENRLSHDEPGYITLVVVVEVIWVLKTVYRITKPNLIILLETLLSTKQLLVERNDLVNKSLKAYQKGNGDFSDALIASVAKADGCSEIITFDRKTSSVGMRLISN